MIIAHLNSELIHFSQKQNASMSVFINILVICINIMVLVFLIV